MTSLRMLARSVSVGSFSFPAAFLISSLSRSILAHNSRAFLAAISAIERDINGSLLGELEIWLPAERARLLRLSALAGPIDYMLKRWGDLARFVEDGRICLTNNAAERRPAWLFAGSDRGAERAAVVITLIITARLNEVDPQAWLADVFARIADLPQSRLHELLPWEWKQRATEPAVAKAA